MSLPRKDLQTTDGLEGYADLHPCRIRRAIHTQLPANDTSLDSVENLFFSFFPQRTIGLENQMDKMIRASYHFISCMKSGIEKGFNTTYSSDYIPELIKDVSTLLSESQSQTFLTQLVKLTVFHDEAAADLRNHLITANAKLWKEFSVNWASASERGWSSKDIREFVSAVTTAIAEVMCFSDGDMGILENSIDKIADQLGWAGHQYIAHKFVLDLTDYLEAKLAPKLMASLSIR
jgi:hypothetical protein